MEGETNTALMLEIQRRLTDDEIGEETVRDVVWEHLKPSTEDLIDKAEVTLYTEDEIPDTTHQDFIVRELARVAYGLADFDAHTFREYLKDMGIYQGHVTSI